MTELLLDDKITKEAYDAKYNELVHKINQAKKEHSLYFANAETQKYASHRMKEIRTCISEANMLDRFDRIVFESIVEKIIVGSIESDGTVDSYKLTFVLKGMDNRIVSDVKRRYKNFNIQDNFFDNAEDGKFQTDRTRELPAKWNGIGTDNYIWKKRDIKIYYVNYPSPKGNGLVSKSMVD